MLKRSILFVLWFLGFLGELSFIPLECLYSDSFMLGLYHIFYCAKPHSVPSKSDRRGTNITNIHYIWRRVYYFTLCFYQVEEVNYLHRWGLLCLLINLLLLKSILIRSMKKPLLINICFNRSTLSCNPCMASGRLDILIASEWLN